MPDESQNNNVKPGVIPGTSEVAVDVRVEPENGVRPTVEEGSAEANKLNAPESSSASESMSAPLPALEPVPVMEAPTPVLPTPMSRPSEERGSTEVSKPNVVPPPKSAKYFLTKALEAIQFRKRAKLEKIIKFITAKGSAGNDQIEKLLHISNATATRYLSQLVREGRLKKIGIGSETRYTL